METLTAPTGIVNKVASSGLITIDLADLAPKDTIARFDLAQFLEGGFLLREKTYREALSNMDFQVFHDAHVAIYSSADAIIPMWAFMLAATYLAPVAKEVHFGTERDIYTSLYMRNVDAHLSTTSYANTRVVVKGCGDVDVPSSAYVKVASALQAQVTSLMFGEPCSTVPLYKKPREIAS